MHSPPGLTLQRAGEGPRNFRRTRGDFDFSDQGALLVVCTEVEEVFKFLKVDLKKESRKCLPGDYPNLETSAVAEFRNH